MIFLQIPLSQGVVPGAFLLLVALLAVTPPLSAQEPAPGSIRLVITYRSHPADRPALLREMRGRGLQRFEEWKRQGVLSDYLVLHNVYCDTTTWDMMAILSFETLQQTERWQRIEEEFPAGLDAELLRLATPATTFIADARWRVGERSDRKKAVYLVIPYDHRDRDEYIDFVNGVLVPQFAGWLRDGGLNNWSILLNMHYPGRPTDVLLILEYDGMEGLAKRNSGRKITADRLSQDPAWKRMREASTAMRDENEVTIARALLPE